MLEAGQPKGAGWQPKVIIRIPKSFSFRETKVIIDILNINSRSYHLYAPTKKKVKMQGRFQPPQYVALTSTGCLSSGTRARSWSGIVEWAARAPGAHPIPRRSRRAQGLHNFACAAPGACVFCSAWPSLRVGHRRLEQRPHPVLPCPLCAARHPSVLCTRPGGRGR